MGSCCPCARLGWLPRRPLAETCVVCGRSPPRFLFFVLSGSACNGVQLGLDRLLILVLPEGRWWVPTLCWTLSYALSITFRFVSHAALVFGPHRDPPLLALGKTYLTYLSTIVSSTGVNLGLVTGAGMSHELALLPTAAFSVLWSYLALSYTWAPGGKASCGCCHLCTPRVSDAQWYRADTPWYRAVASQPSTEEHTPVRRPSVSLSSAAWLAPGVPEWAGLSPSLSPAATEKRARAGGIISERMAGVSTSPASGVGIHACTDSPRNSSHELLSLSEQEQPVLPPDLLLEEEGQATVAPCSPLPVSMPRR
mmetsp:Transcript_29614/g.75226  ORF Transcript_29614/g.75226 Transcript_29614/m.75226 type:complete len:310 (-) Transcript_29614:170-1099(-)